MEDSPAVVSNPTAVTGTPIPTQPWEDFDTILHQAERARVLNDKQHARTLYARLVELNPNDPQGWAGLGETADTTDEAIISWAYTLALAPDSWEARVQMDTFIEERIAQSGIADAGVLLALARTLVEVGQKPSAYRLVTHATELDPTKVDAWLWRAGIAEDHVDTINCLRHALSLDPANAQGKAGLEWALSRQRAAAFTQKPSDPTGATELFEEGQGVLNSGKLANAYTLFVKSTELNPDDESAWFWRGSTAPNTEEGLACMEQTLRINPQHQAAKDTQWYLRVKKYREAFSIRATTPLSLYAPEAEQVPTPPTRKHSIFKTVLAVAAFILFVLVALTIAVVWQLSR